MSLLRALQSTSVRTVCTISRHAAPRRLAAVTQCQRRTFFSKKPEPEQAEPMTAEQQKQAMEMAEKIMQSEEWRKISAHPPAVKAVEKCMEIISSRGMAVQPGQAPKIRDMMKLAMDPDFRAALQTVKVEFKAAGVDPENPEIMKKMMEGQGLGGGKKGWF